MHRFLADFYPSHIEGGNNCDLLETFVKESLEFCPWLNKESVRNVLRRHSQLMLTSRVDSNVPPSVAEQETNEIVEMSGNSEIDNATERTNVESTATIVAKAGRPCGTSATQVRKVTKNYDEAMNEACAKCVDARKNRLLKFGELRKSCELVEESWFLQKRNYPS